MLELTITELFISTNDSYKISTKQYITLGKRRTHELPNLQVSAIPHGMDIGDNKFDNLKQIFRITVMVHIFGSYYLPSMFQR